MNNGLKIDFVVTWVNGNDLEWQRKKNFYQRQESPTIAINDSQRYRQMGSLENWVDRVLKYAPWVNKVFIVKDNQDLGFELPNSKFVKVNHSDFIDKKYLPVFNSNSIEMNIDLIEDLSEHFVLFNDDVYLTAPVTKSDFFDDNGTPVEVGYMTILHASELFQHTTLNNLVYINKKFNKKQILKSNASKYINPIYGTKNLHSVFSLPWSDILGWHDEHITSSYKKSTFKEVYECFPELRESQSGNKFRTYSDVSHVLMKYWQIAKGDFIPRKPDSFGRYVWVSEGPQTEIEAALTGKWKVVCINDDEMNDNAAEKAEKSLIKLLKKTI
ncbi:Stealth CR1 domain-containing protein [Weissella cibaria]|uniref:Stealth CR1 domain-containing protein n=1 Tax=Weissella cibaria TaxID=137591 RepID=UPI001CC3FE48|nr:Stealth CR1 domain-containing protein [Weissella cibaria]MBZ6069146.1 Stealth CR1 domain-containing protein [Weissella cibaria]